MYLCTRIELSQIEMLTNLLCCKMKPLSKSASSIHQCIFDWSLIRMKTFYEFPFQMKSNISYFVLMYAILIGRFTESERIKIVNHHTKFRVKRKCGSFQETHCYRSLNTHATSQFIHNNIHFDFWLRFCSCINNCDGFSMLALKFLNFVLKA